MVWLVTLSHIIIWPIFFVCIIVIFCVISAQRHEEAFGHAEGDIGLGPGSFNIKREACDGDIMCPILPNVSSFYTSNLTVLESVEVTKISKPFIFNY